MLTFNFGNGHVLARRHVNPDGTAGGWVADTAYVAPSVFLGFEACVFEFARVLDNAIVYGHAKVFGNACVKENAHIYGGACVYGNAGICDHAQVFGNSYVYGYALVKDFAKVHEHAEVFGTSLLRGSACARGKAILRNKRLEGHDVYDTNGLTIDEDHANTVLTEFIDKHLK